MPNYRVTVLNSEFSATNDTEATSLKDARRLALKGAFAIGAEEVANGLPFFGAEVTVSGYGDTERFVVSVGASHLK